MAGRDWQDEKWVTESSGHSGQGMRVSKAIVGADQEGEASCMGHKKKPLKWPIMQHSGHMGQVFSNLINGWNMFQESSQSYW